MLLDDPTLVQSHILYILQQIVGESFQPKEWQRSFTRDELYDLLQKATKQSLKIYRENFASGMTKIFAEVRERPKNKEEATPFV